MLRWKIRKKMIVGIAAMADAAMMRFSGVVVAPVLRPDGTIRIVLSGEKTAEPEQEEVVL